ncbi:Flagellar FliL protein [Syntrophobacter sp. SbD1]|nr:Flagellar FliL protein [Syntrophobacter sp. SbD1]
MPPEEEQTAVQEKPKSKKLLIIVILALVLLGGGGAGAYFKFFRAANDMKGEEQKKETEPVFHEVDTFMVNLADAGGKRFLKATMKFKVDSPSVADECKSRNFEIRDIILTLLTSKETTEVITPDDKLALKKQIMETVNSVLRKGHIQDVYFTDFIIQ